MLLCRQTRAFVLAAMLLAATIEPHATTFTVFGPRTLTRTTGAPNVFDFTFGVANPSLPYTLRIDNHGVDSAIVILNGVQIVGPSDCRSNSKDDWRKAPDWDDDDWAHDRDRDDDGWRTKHNWKGVIERPVRLRASNTMRVELRSQPGTHLRIQIYGKDEFPPTITATATPAPNPAGWNRTDVQVSFVCSDGGSGIAACTPAKVVTTEGKGQIVTGTAVDNAGNAATAKVMLDIDKTAPAITAQAQPAPNGEGWIISAATVTFACADDRSGVASCPAPIAVPADGGNQIVRGTAVDKAGNAAETILSVNVDKTPPTITATMDPPPNGTGWHDTDVTVTFACADAASGISFCPPPVMVSGDGANQAISGTTRDRAGNTASASVTVSIDKTSPIVLVASPQANATLRTSPANLSGSVSDSLSGIAAATCNGASVTPGLGGLVSCGPALVNGPNTLTLAATDAAGNVATSQVDVTFVVNRSPVGDAGGPYAGLVGELVSFTAIGTDPDSDRLTFAWDFGNGPVIGQTVTHTYTSAGAFTAELTISDDYGGTTTGTAHVTVVQPNRAPMADAGGSYTADVGQDLELTGSRSTDPDGDPLTYSWNFGDGGTATGVSATHIFVTAGTYTVTLTVDDGRGGANSASTAATITSVGTPAADRGVLGGEVYDDSKGLPLANATVMLLADGSGPLLNPLVVIADERGQFTLPVKQGDATIRIEKVGFTTVERTASIPANKAITVLDARLTPLDARTNPIQPALNDVARNTAGDVTLSLPPGSVATTVALRVTALSNQGLGGLLPFGWSAAVAVDIDPPGVVFHQTALLKVPNTVNLPAGAQVPVALYDPHQHRWMAIASAQVSANGRQITGGLDTSGQFVFVIGDDAPFTPPPPVAGQPLTGVSAVALGPADTATGIVAPRSAPPGDTTRAIGAIDLRPAAPLPSGTVLQAFVTEQYNLFDSSRVAPLPFTQDIVLYAKPGSRNGAPLTASFPITPSIAFSIQQLERGVVAIDVTPPAPHGGRSIVGASGGTATDASGDFVQIPAGAIATDTVVEITALSPDRIAVSLPAGFERLAALQVDVGGVSLNQGAILSIPRPASLADTAQVIVAEVIGDTRAVRRLRIVGVGRIASGRVAVQTALNGLTFPGIAHGGQYLFLRAPSPLGFITGHVLTAGGTPRSLALVSADTAPFADVTGATGAYIVAGGVASPSQITAVAPAAAITGTTTLTAANQVARLDLLLGDVALSVVNTTPAANAGKVPLNSPVVVQFSEPLDAATATTASIALQASGSAVAGNVTLSPDRRIATFLPAVELHSSSVYSLVLSTALRGDSGTRLTPFTPVSFTTVDTSKPQVTPGQISADLPDGDGLVLIFGTSGVAEPSSGVTAANLRTQETATVLASADGSFRLRLPAVIGDEVSVTLRDAQAREVTVSITQFDGADGTTAIGRAGGRIAGPGGRTGTVRPRALGGAATFKMSDSIDATAFPSLPTDFTYADRFTLSFQGGPFNQLRSFTLSESQNRFLPGVMTSAPFESTGSLVVPADFLVTGTVKFSATAEDTGGNRNAASGSMLVVTANPATASIETKFETTFPAVFLVAPKEAVPGQQVGVTAVAPTARVDFDLAVPAGLDPSAPVLLVRATQVGSELKLSVVDQLATGDVDGVQRLKTMGKLFAGAAAAGNYGVVVSSVPMVFVSGQIAGPARIVAVEHSPFVVEPSGPNARFLIPVAANRPFVLNFIDRASGLTTATTAGQAPPTGVVALNQTIGAPDGALSVTAMPDASSLVDINEPVVFRFSAPIDRRTLAGNILIADSAGIEVFGRLDVSTDGLRVTFIPNRRWRFGASYRYTVSPRLLAVSGGRRPQIFSGSFTTFAPKLVGTLSAGTIRDVAVSGNTVIAGGASGLTVVDATRPESPVQLAQMAVGTSVGAVGLLPQAHVTDRNGTAVNGVVGIAAIGSDATVGQLQIYDLNNPESPALIGTAQLTVPAGQSAPPNVPASPGTPGAIALTPDQRALAAVAPIGVESVNLGAAIPVDAANPGGALGPRFPANAFEGATHVVVAGNKALVAGVSGLTILDLSTLNRLGSTSTGGNTQGVAGLQAFRMDMNGDGTIESPAEIFDLAVIANGPDGTLQFFNISDAASPRLISVVRLAGDVTSVALDASENLAYVGNGSRGIAIVDLVGSVSIQPIDLDRNGVDDRVLGTVLTRASAGRLALSLARGIAYVADGPAGLAVVQLVPPRTRFTSVLRDPLSAATGDEQSISDTGTAVTTDDGLSVALNAVLPPQTSLFLTINEVPNAGDERMLSFADGSTSAPLINGANTLPIRIAGNQTSAGSRASLRIQDAGGRATSVFDLRISAPDTTGLTLTSLFTVPQVATLGGSDDHLAIRVGGLWSDGRILNLTRAATGTIYRVDRSSVASIDADGEVTPLAGGAVRVTASNGGLTAQSHITVKRPSVLTALEVIRPLITFTAVGAQAPINVAGRFSDGHVEDITRGFNTVFSSDNSQVVSVTADGILSAVGAGTAVVSVANGSLHSQVRIAVEIRITPRITGITLASFGPPITTDASEAQARATVSGAGSLEGLTITFSLSGVASGQFTGITDYSGVAIARLTGLTVAGTGTVTASIIGPTSGAVSSDSGTLTVARGSGDQEPNGGVATASPLAVSKTITGSIGAGSDPEDTYRLQLSTDGVVRGTLTLADGMIPSQILVRVLAADGTELGRFTPTARTTTFNQQVRAGASFLSVEATGAGGSYNVATAFDQGPVSVSAASPTTGVPGTPVTITGTGFSTVPAENLVFFAKVSAKVVSSTSTELHVEVPVNAVDGPLSVIVGSREGAGPAFVTGSSGPLPPITFVPPTAPVIRLDPVAGVPIDLTRLRVYFDPGATRAAADALAMTLGGRIVGFIPMVNTYVFEFPNITTFAALEAIKRQIESNPSVLYAARNTYSKPSSAGMQIDLRNSSSHYTWGPGVPAGNAFSLANIFEAIDRIRSTPPFDDAANLRRVTIAILDTGFDPDPSLFSQEFVDRNTGNMDVVIDLFGPTCPQQPVPLLVPPFGCTIQQIRFPDPDGDPGDHGTAIASIVAALNNGVEPLSGVLTSVFKHNESPLSRIKVLMFKVTEDATDPDSLMDDTLILATLWHLFVSGDVDVANLSFGATHPALDQTYLDLVASYRTVFQALQPRTLIVAAAGNEGVDALYSTPSALSASLDNVVSVAGVAVSNLDNTSEGKDSRSIMDGKRDVPDNFQGNLCDREVLTAESNCGPTVTIAAPGEDIPLAVAADAVADVGDIITHDAGTSLASPIVASVAAILQMIRRDPAVHLRPARLKQILVDTGSEIGHGTPLGHWYPDASMKRLNALDAVLAVLQPSDAQFVYVADQDATDPQSNATGKVVAIEIDPLTGDRPTGATDRVLGPTYSFGSLTFEASGPIAAAVSPAGDHLYVVAENSVYGHGLIVINTRNFRAEGFIPLSGAAFPPPSTGPPVAARNPVRLPTNRPGMAFSNDGRLLYVATGATITIVNTVVNKVVEKLADLPSEYNVFAGTLPANTLSTRRFLALEGLVTSPSFGPGSNVPGLYISNLALSPDGATLYAVVQLPGVSATGALPEGGVKGQQPGAIVAIDVDLYRDKDPAVPGLQSDLDRYFAIKLPILQMPAGNINNVLRPLGDEPKGLTVAPDGKHLYLVNGGLDYFQGYSPSALDLNTFFNLLMGPAAGIVFHGAGFSGGINGIMQGLAAFDPIAHNDFTRLKESLEAQMNSGFTLIGAPGFTGVFSAIDHTDGGGSPYPGSTFEWMYPSDIAFGWNPETTAGAITHLNLGQVFASRPFGMAIRHDGRRALVPYFQTGNFGVLDLRWQEKFEVAPPSFPSPNHQFGSLDEAMFRGVVGVTPSLKLDRSLWPNRGSIKVGRPGGSTFFSLPSPDEALLYPWDMQYAQNGRFAVAVHSGTGKGPGRLAAPQVVTGCAAVPFDVCGLLPDKFDVEIKTQLSDLGFHPEMDVFPGNSIAVPTGGGAISIVKDAAIDADFAANLLTDRVLTDRVGRRRAYYSLNPVCEQVALDSNGNPQTYCEKEAVTHHIGYNAPSFVRFAKPRGLAIQPFVVFEAPRFGDRVDPATAIQIGWRDSRVDSYALEVFAIDPLTGATTPVGLNTGPLTQYERDQRTLKREFEMLFRGAAQPAHLKKYRIEARVFVTGDTDPLSRTHIDVTFELPPPRLTSIFLSPRSATKRRGGTVQYRAAGNFSDGHQEDLTTTATWQSSNPPVATIAAGGLATAVAPGEARITASQDGVTSSAATLRVVALQSIRVTPETAAIETGGTQQYHAVGMLTDGSVEDPLSNVNWVSSETGVATIDPSSGLATGNLPIGVTVGQTSITAAAVDGATTITSNMAELTVTRTAGAFVVINEVVVQPQRDWNDSGPGGDGVPFNATPGTSVAPSAAVTAADQWIELTNFGSPVDLTGWTLTLTTGGVPVTIGLAPGAFGPGQVRVIGAPPGLTTATTITLTDSTGATRDTADLVTVHANLGPATSVSDEAVRKVPGGGPASFVRGVATIGQQF